eukprot:6053156-Prorocentrum_lima.AAC.1
MCIRDRIKVEQLHCSSAHSFEGICNCMNIRFPEAIHRNTKVDMLQEFYDNAVGNLFIDWQGMEALGKHCFCPGDIE